MSLFHCQGYAYQPATDWLPFRGDYEKRMHLVRTPDGKEHGPCWPNAGDFWDLAGHQDIPGAAVTHFLPLREQDDPYDEAPDPTIYFLD